MLLLASQSPRRHELLNQIRVRHQVVKVECDESRLPHETPRDYVCRLALAKARVGFTLYGKQPTLGSDTIVVLDGRVLGKPRDRSDGIDMLRGLSGREHLVLTAVALVSRRGTNTRLSENRVRFGQISESEAALYWATGEPCDKAGGYAIQGLGAVFIRRLIGSYSGVMGLPLCETAELLCEARLPVGLE